MVDQRQAGTVVELGRVVGVDVGRTLPPAFADVGLGLDHQHLADGLLAEGGAEGTDQGKADAVEVDGEEAHGRIIAPASVTRAFVAGERVSRGVPGGAGPDARPA